MIILIAIVVIFLKGHSVLGLEPSLKNCLKSNIHFEKVIGLPRIQFSGEQLLFELKPNERQRPIILDCLKICQENDECISFMLQYDTNKCYWFKEDLTKIQGATRLEVDNNSVWFDKTCFITRNPCKKLWIFERIRGATLVGNDTKVIDLNMTRKECEQKCLDEKDFHCKSVKFLIPLYPNFPKNNESTGKCILSNTDRHLMPTGYRVSTFNDYYLENQCEISDNLTNKDTGQTNYCTYEEYDEVQFKHADVLLENRTKDDCERECNTYENFNCRGYTISKENSCMLHSEDTKLMGPRILSSNKQFTYYEKARCLNITVSCTDNFMIVEYKPETDFRGKLYMQGYSDDPGCFVMGKGKFAIVTLKLPLLMTHCGILKAGSLTSRTLLSGLLIIQYNSLIQTQSDRILKVGCIFNNENKVLIGTGVTISSNLPNKGGTLINSSKNHTFAPMVEMKIVDLKSKNEITDSQIGQELQLVIELKEKTNTYDFWASDLIAMTEKGDESIVLIDEYGCPTNLNIFPPLTKVVENGTRKIQATFQAFKFASSSIIRFSVLVQFCLNACMPIKCKNNVESYGKKKREISSRNEANLATKSSVMPQMPLEYVMVVRSLNSHPDRLILGNNDGKLLVAGFNYATNEVCMDFSLVIGLIITWILIQLIFVIACICLIRQYKKYYQEECRRLTMENFNKNFGLGLSNLESRRVRWADDTDNIM
ncbi:hypothetical protein ABEB36_008963 [Hypothenemus hampei]|uniref:Uncharacterized protein n=1 Tax=Hypothenemus hampei TaxID=57062 RepID=A0ABD1ENN5_HYPHA